ncbi:MAG: hypothetical protein JOY60_13375 [Burkholderiaceae bacterium]|nr:hypothetical protein [Roseateles sp.]MBV8470838.1 hypothetical protein [Burkholderiaceae bacterium]
MDAMSDVSSVFETLSLDRWLRQVRLPFWTPREVRRLRLGQCLTLVDYCGPGLVQGLNGRAQVLVTREEQGFRMESLWTLKPCRVDAEFKPLWGECTFGLAPPRRLQLWCDSAQEAARAQAGFRVASLVLRRSAWLAHLAQSQGHEHSARLTHPALFLSRALRGENGGFLPTPR